MGFLWRGPTEQHALVVLAKLRSRRADVERQMRQLAEEIPATDDRDIARPTQLAAENFRELSGQAQVAAMRLKAQRTAAFNNYRRFQYERGVMRPARKPDWLVTAIVLQVCGVVEGGITAALMVGNGEMDVISAVIYGLSVAFINVLIGVVAGFLPGRYATYNQDANEPGRHDHTIRTTARVGLILFAIAALALHFGAARVRATGSHSGIFDFSDVSLAATFNDYFAIAIVVVGLIGTLIAFYEGYFGLSDPVPDYTRARVEAEGKVDAEAHDQERGIIAQAEDRYFNSDAECEAQGNDRMQAIADYRLRYDELDGNIRAYNNAVLTDKDKLRALVARRNEGEDFVEQKKARRLQVDVDAFDKLLISNIGDRLRNMEMRPQGLEDGAEARARLRADFEQCTRTVREAFASVFIDAHEFSLSTGEER